MLRVILISLLGCLIAVSVSLVFDNKNLLKGFLLGGAISGIIAGLIIELGFLYLPWIGILYRALADIIMALVFTLIPINIDVKDYSKTTYMDKEKDINFSGNNNFNSFK